MSDCTERGFRACLGCGLCVRHAMDRAEETLAQAQEAVRQVAETREETRRWLEWRDQVYGRGTPA